MTEDEFDVRMDTDASSTEEFGDPTDTGLYGDQEKADSKAKTLKSVRGDSSDEVDPRKLVRDPTLSEIRWYYRRTFAKKLVDKPIEDAFKNGLEFKGDRAQEAQRLIDEPRYGRGNDGFLEAHMMAEKKARRDGFALIFLGLTDNSDGVWQSPINDDVNVVRINHLKVFTIDHLTASGGPNTEEQIQRGTGLERGEYHIRETGIVVNTDIGSEDYRQPVGYILDDKEGTFIHADRVIHYTWNPEVDGDYKGSNIQRFSVEETTLGEYEGDSVLIPSYDLLKGISKGNWAVMQSLFRNASHMYHITLPEDATEEDLDSTNKEARNINAKSAMIFPFGYEMKQHESGNEIDPRNFYEAIFDQVCAVHEMTKSVLFGTQSGTVSGSETDIKNYFNKVERYRTQRAERKINEYLTRVKKIKDNRTDRNFVFEVDVEWGPLFKVDRQTQLQMFQTHAQGLATLLGQYMITPDEARAILSEEWASIDLDDLTQEQMDVLDRINLAQVGQGEFAEANDPEPDNPQRGGQEGGRPEGARQGAEQSGATPGQDEDFLDRLAEKVADKLEARLAAAA